MIGQARSHSDKGCAVVVVAAAMCLPKRRQAEEADPNAEGLGVRQGRWSSAASTAIDVGKR
jgi:hypothetical protein